MKKAIVLFSVLFSLLLLSFPAGAADEGAPAVGPNAGNRIPAFTAKSPIDQKDYATKDLLVKGKDTALLFMQTACSLCVAEIRDFIGAKEEIEGKLNVVVAAVDVNPDRIGQYLQNLGVTFTAIHDKDGNIMDSLKFTSTPSLAILNDQGIIKEKFVGYDAAKVRTLLKSYK